MVPHDDDHNYDDDWNGPTKYEFCRPGTDPNFNTYKSLMSLAFGGCYVNSLAYGDKHAEKIFKQDVMAISGNLNRAFNLSRPCALCGKAGHSFDDCEELKDPVAIQKAYISLHIGFQKLKGIATSQRCDINFIQSYKIFYVNSVDFLPPSSSSIDSATNDRLDTLERVLVNTIRATRLTNSKISS